MTDSVSDAAPVAEVDAEVDAAGDPAADAGGDAASDAAAGPANQRISPSLARALRDSGLNWRPAAGDAFVIDRVEADDEIFILSEMTVEAHHFPTGTELGFNGTTEWALDSVPLGDALWLPQENQLRELLGPAFVSLATSPPAAMMQASDFAGFSVTSVIDGERLTFTADAAVDAYARALLALLDSLTAD